MSLEATIPKRHGLTNARSASQGLVQDRLTIARLLLITAGIAIGIVLFMPKPEEWDFADDECWRQLWNGILAGAVLPCPIFALQSRRRRIGPGGLLSIALSFGILLMIPPAFMQRFFGNKSEAVACLFYTLPLLSLWFLLAVIASGQLRWRTLTGKTPWSDRYGFYLAICWAPLGIWILYEFYEQAFF